MSVHAIIFDAEYRYDQQAHARYQASERYMPGDPAAPNDPRVTPRWPLHEMVSACWLVLADDPETGLRPVRMVSIGLPEIDEAAALRALFDDLAYFDPNTRFVTWGGFAADGPRLLTAAMKHELRLPLMLRGLADPFNRRSSNLLDLLSPICGGAGAVHMSEIAARLDRPAKLTCRADLVSALMERGKWSEVKSVCEGDVLTTAMLLMRYLHVQGDGPAPFGPEQALCRFAAETMAHRGYADTYTGLRQRLIGEAFEKERQAFDAGHIALI